MLNGRERRLICAACLKAIGQSHQGGISKVDSVISMLGERPREIGHLGLRSMQRGAAGVPFMPRAQSENGNTDQRHKGACPRWKTRWPGKPVARLGTQIGLHSEHLDVTGLMDCERSRSAGQGASNSLPPNGSDAPSGAFGERSPSPRHGAFSALPLFSQSGKNRCVALGLLSKDTVEGPGFLLAGGRND